MFMIAIIYIKIFFKLPWFISEYISGHSKSDYVSGHHSENHSVSSHHI